MNREKAGDSGEVVAAQPVLAMPVMSLDLSTLSKSITIWDLIVGVATGVCTYIVFKNGSDHQQLLHIAIMVVLYAMALRVVIIKLTCDTEVAQADVTRALVWSSAFIAYLAIKYTINAAQQEDYVRAVMEGLIAFLFLFLFMKGVTGKLKVE